MKYYTIVTEAGANAITQAIVQGKKVNITHFAVGDGNGNYYEPNTSMTALKREKWRGEVSKYEIDKLSSNIIKVSAIIPQNIGGFTMREMGLFDDKNNLIAVCNTPDLVKVILEDGISTEVEVSMRIAVTNTEVIQFNVDPTVIMATKKDIENAIDIHSIDENVHKNLFDLKANKDLSNVTQQTIINKINSTNFMQFKNISSDITKLSDIREIGIYHIFNYPAKFTDFPECLSSKGNLYGILKVDRDSNYVIQRLSCVKSGTSDLMEAINFMNLKSDGTYNQSGWELLNEKPDLTVKADKDLSNVTQQTIINKINSTENGNTLNADMVDSKHSNDFLGNTEFIYRFKNGDNIDDIKVEYHGFVFNCQGTPTANEYGFLDVSKFNGVGFSPSSNKPVIKQIFTRYSNMNMFIRIYREDTDTWTDWKNISDGGNADTLEGKHISDLQNYNNLTNKPASLPANGGNADTVDGKHASDFVHTKSLVAELGQYIDFHSSESAADFDLRLYMLTDKSNLAIQGKGELIHEGNLLDKVKTIDGAGSGIDADTVDGKQASDLQNYNNLTNKPTSLPANGGNADTVDGKHANDFMQFKNISSDITNLSDIREIGNYIIVNGGVKFTDFPECLSSKGIVYGILKVDKGANYVVQRLSCVDAGTSNLTEAINFINLKSDGTYRQSGWKLTNENASTIEGYSVSALLDYFKEEVSVIKSIQRGVVQPQNSNYAYETVKLNKINIEKSIVILNTKSVNKSNVDMTGVYHEFDDGGDLRLYIGNHNLKVSWQVIEFN